MVIGRLRSRSWETPEGERRSVTEVEAEEIGPSLKFAIAKGIAAYRGRAIALRVPSPESPAEGLAVWGLVEQAGNLDRQALRSLISTGRWRVGRGTTLKRST